MGLKLNCRFTHFSTNEINSLHTSQGYILEQWEHEKIVSIKCGGFKQKSHAIVIVVDKEEIDNVEAVVCDRLTCVVWDFQVCS